MKVSSISLIKPVVCVALLTGIGYRAANSRVNAQNNLTTDVIELNFKICPKGTNNPAILKTAPMPYTKIQGKNVFTKIVIDISKNILYKYDDYGNPSMAYLVASGKKNNPTETGIRVVSHIESYPYQNAPTSSNRRNNPNAFGPKILCLKTVNPETGELGTTGQFIHGNNNESSLGKYVSMGCIRMDNDVIVQLSEEIKHGDYIHIIE